MKNSPSLIEVIIGASLLGTALTYNINQKNNQSRGPSTYSLEVVDTTTGIVDTVRKVLMHRSDDSCVYGWQKKGVRESVAPTFEYCHTNLARIIQKK